MLISYEITYLMSIKSLTFFNFFLSIPLFKHPRGRKKIQKKPRLRGFC